jgi:hypothetical protein
MTQVKHISYYTNVMQNWSRELGGKPTEAQLSLAHVFGRPGKQSLAVAMALRDGGVSGGQVKLASSLFDGLATPQLNHMRDLVAAKLFTREAVPGYTLTLAPKGQQFVDLHGARQTEKLTAKAEAPKAEKPKSAKSARKAERKAKAKAAQTEQAANEPAVTAGAVVAELATPVAPQAEISA